MFEYKKELVKFYKKVTNCKVRVLNPDGYFTKHPQRSRKAGVPNGNQTRISAVKERLPRSLKNWSISCWI